MNIASHVIAFALGGSIGIMALALLIVGHDD